MTKVVNLETFRCACTEENGQRCPSDFTAAVAFVPTLTVLAHRGQGPVTLEMIAQNAICPFHARFLEATGQDISPLTEAVANFTWITRRAKRADQRILAAKEVARRAKVACTTTMGYALRTALAGN
jgi:hypothetical protein